MAEAYYPVDLGGKLVNNKYTWNGFDLEFNPLNANTLANVIKLNIGYKKYSLIIGSFRDKIHLEKVGKGVTYIQDSYLEFNNLLLNIPTQPIYVQYETKNYTYGK